MSSQRGFTLVELVMVIVLLGIVATISVQFVALSTQGAIDVGDRQQRALQGVVVSEQITRQLREAHPLSIRVRADSNQQCIEWIPILAATSYDSLPFSAAANEGIITPLSTDVTAQIKSSPSSFRLAVYGYSATNFFDTSVDPAPISPPISDIQDNGAVANGKVILQGNHRFQSQSPTKRLYVIREPVSICQDDNRLYRFEGYGLRASQPSYGDLNGLGAGIIAANLKPDSFRVKFIPASLRRSAIVNFAFVLTSPSGEETRLSQEVQIRNVP
ncbi:type II secretion system protein [Marinobacter oulmenensis]|uniref:MSHA biogenesis protein MshO n=1 Tax=Marinobacter oulmenensis TaxID=643747 RepID=A0A840UN33_9GAMM|nr:type II secretion system protein [Marinobacter oulmenensis]MBB5322257.1 MSHA biogenesis protein MshO [Marinobacter oulmenensis]